MHIRRSIPLLVLLVGVVSLYAFPLAEYVLRVGDSWQGIMPAHIEDAEYYYARIHEVAEGKVFMGNPVYQEHEYAIAPSWGIAEFFAALPLMATGSWTFTIIFNIFFWALASTVLIYATFRLFGLSRWASAFGAFFVSLQLVLLTTRPVSMQVPYASLFLFIYLLSLWMCRGGYRYAVFLGAASVGALMTYTFTGQVVAGVLVMIGLLCLVYRQWTSLLQLCVGGVVALPLFLAYVWIMWAASSDPYYFETLIRFGLVETRFPMIDVYFYGRWLVAMAVAYVLLWFSSETLRVSPIKMRTSLALLFGVAVTFFVPLVVGKDIESAVHIGRLVFPIVAFTLVLFVSDAFLHFRKWSLLFIFSLVCVFIVLLGIGKNVYDRNLIDVPQAESLREIQSYAPVLSYIRDHGTGTVVWAPDELAPFVLTHTHAKVLFAQQGGLYTIPTEEQHDRYLVSRFPQKMNTTTLAHDVGLYDLVIPKSYGEFALRIRPCSFSGTCEPLVAYSEHKGSQYFESLLSRYENNIVPNIERSLDTYHVRFIVAPSGEELNPSIVAKKVYTDSKYSLYERE